MKIFVFDTETTWFINKKEKDLSFQPHIIQFAWILGELKADGSFVEEKQIDILIDPGIPIPYASSQVHHIYDIDIKKAPKIEEVIDEIVWYINDPDIIIGHNIEYDEDMVKLELKRLQMEYRYKPRKVSCTMKESVDYCAMQGKWERFKYPKLWELHKKLFWEYFLWAHDALTDVKATLRCYLELVKEWIMVAKLEKSDNKISLF